MQPTGILPGTIRILATHSPDLLSELLTPGKVLEAEVISVYGDRAMLSLGKNLRLEATLQAPLREGQRVHVQVQPREVPAQGDPRPPFFLKIVSGPGTEATAPQSGAVVAPSLPEAAAQQASTQPGQPQVLWVPIPLPQGGQAWAQIHVQEEGAKKRGRSAPAHQVRVFWETPGLGPVQVTLDSTASSLTALFTITLPETRAAVERDLPALQQRLHEAGYTDTRLGARLPAPGELVEPQRSADSGRLNVRV